ncbi:MAG: zinc dependent phospholipase C family protein [Lachnospiraceae bacterium]
MPSTYAHYRLGKEVKNSLREEERTVIIKNRELFQIGLHGPDLLFYYKPLKNNPVNQMGFAMHKRPGKEFFANAANVVKEHHSRSRYLAYVYGFICHFALDESCHGYIDEKIAASGLSHTEIEVEFDRMLMVQDNLDPIRQKLTEHIVPTLKNAEVIQAFFQGVDSEKIYKAMKGMIFHNNLLVAPNKGKRLVIDTLLSATGHYEEMHGLMVNYEKNPQCEDSCRKLWLLYQDAKELAVTLIHEFRDYLEGRLKLDEVYDYTFGSQLIEEKEIGHAV